MSNAPATSAPSRTVALPLLPLPRFLPPSALPLPLPLPSVAAAGSTRTQACASHPQRRSSASTASAGCCGTTASTSPGW